jgi:hypothetical protein
MSEFDNLYAKIWWDLIPSLKPQQLVASPIKSIVNRNGYRMIVEFPYDQKQRLFSEIIMGAREILNTNDK